MAKKHCRAGLARTRAVLIPSRTQPMPGVPGSPHSCRARDARGRCRHAARGCAVGPAVGWRAPHGWTGNSELRGARGLSDRRCDPIRRLSRRRAARPASGATPGEQPGCQQRTHESEHRCLAGGSVSQPGRAHRRPSHPPPVAAPPRGESPAARPSSTSARVDAMSCICR